jgi:hypothetical protein
MSDRSVPDAVRRAVEADLSPVRPLAAPWQRAALATVVAVVAAAIGLLTAPLRLDLTQLPMWIGWGASLAELCVGVGLVSVGLRESVPGAGLSSGATAATATGAMALQVGVGLVTWHLSPAVVHPSSPAAAGFGCMTHEAALALPTFVVTLWLVFRALPLRAPTAGLLGGAGAAMAADAVLHLLCPVADLDHVLVWHTGTIVVFATAGWLTGAVWERIRWRR